MACLHYKIELNKLPTPIEIKDPHNCFLFLLCERTSSSLGNVNAEMSIAAKVRRAGEKRMTEYPSYASMTGWVLHMRCSLLGSHKGSPLTSCTRGNCHGTEEQKTPSSNLLN